MVRNGSLQSQDEKMKSGSVEVRTSRSVLPNHFWIGVNGVAG
jgi:hypothetical protein